MALIDELKRRNVFRVGGAYLALGWIVTQIAATMVEVLHLPAWVAPTVFLIGAAGFPFALLFAWAYELTPEGLKREHEVDRSQSITHLTSRRLDFVIIGLMVVAIALFALHEFRPSPAADAGADGRAHGALLREDADGRAHGALLPEDADGRAHGALLREDVGAGHARDTNAAAAPAPDDKSIAVLPFVNMSSDKEQEYFSDGISEELLNLLAKVPELKVAARTSSFSFKGKELEIPEIAARLRVAHVLEGSVRKAGSTVRITAQLVRAADGYHLWSETYDRPLDNIFALQDEIAAAVVGQLKIKLLGAAPKSQVRDPKAYALYLRARQLGELYTPEAFDASDELYRQALAIDPRFPEAWRKLAANSMNAANSGARPLEEGYAKGREYIAKALAIDPEFGRGYDGLATVSQNYDADLVAAAGYWQRALRLDPTNLNILSNSTGLLSNLGRCEQALVVDQYVAERDPLSPISHLSLGFDYQCLGRLEESLQAFRTALSVAPGSYGRQSDITIALVLMGNAEPALEAARAEPSESNRLFAVALAEHAAGHRAESDAALAGLIDKYAASTAYRIAAVMAWRGDNDRAFEWLDKAFANHDFRVSAMAIEPLLAGLHQDPRWLPYLRKHGLAPEQLAAIPFEVKLPG